jgi:hypothetical protein
MINLDYQKRHILSSLQVGLEVEFYTNLPGKLVKRLLSQHLKKRIALKGKPTRDTFKIVKDYSGGAKMHEIITGVMPYDEAKVVLLRILSWIRDNGWTDESTSIHLNISFDKEKIDLKEKIEHLNNLKFILGFNEDFIFDRFPRRKQTMYARSIDQIIPNNKFAFNGNVKSVDHTLYKVPDSKYYGVNFSKKAKGYLEIRYLGGRRYETRGTQILEILDYSAFVLYDTLQDNYGYTQEEVSKLNYILKDYKDAVRSFKDFESFMRFYPNMILTVDLKAQVELIKTFYPKIREQLFDLLVLGNVKKGYLNFDADVSKFQLKDSVIKNAFPVSNMEIFDSTISGNIEDCDLFNCRIFNGHIIDSKIFRGNHITKSKIHNTPIHYENKIEDSYIDNRIHPINGEIIGGVIRSGDIGYMADISDTTEVIEGAVRYLGQEKGKKGSSKKDKYELKDPEGFKKI